MPSKEKKEKVKQLKTWFEKQDQVLLLHYKGLRVSESNELRNLLGQAGGELKVVKNTLSRIALTGTDKEGLVSLFDGPTAVVSIREEPTGVARVLREFSRGRPDLYFQGGLLGDRLLSRQQVETLSMLPPRDSLLAQMVGQLAAPLSGLVGVCAGPIRKMLGLFSAVAEQKGATRPAGTEDASGAGAVKAVEAGGAGKSAEDVPAEEESPSGREEDTGKS